MEADSTEVAAFADRSRTVALANAPLPGLVAPNVFYGERRRTSPCDANDSRNQRRCEMFVRPSEKPGEDPCQKGDSNVTARPGVKTGADPCTKGADPCDQGDRPSIAAGEDPCNKGDRPSVTTGEDPGNTGDKPRITMPDPALQKLSLIHI